MAADSSGKIVLQINVQTTSSVLLHLNEHEWTKMLSFFFFEYLKFCFCAYNLECHCEVSSGVCVQELVIFFSEILHVWMCFQSVKINL